MSGRAAALLAALPLLLGCPAVEPALHDAESGVAYEALRRRVEGGVRSAAHARAVEDAIASLAADLGGTASTSLAERMAALAVPGVVVAVVDRGVVEWVEAFGVYDVAAGTPLWPQAPMQGASISKVVTAILMLHLVEEGEIDLDAPLSDALRSWTLPRGAQTPERPATLRGVLSHTAGFGVPGFVGYAPGAAWPTLAERLDGRPPANHPAIRVVSTPGAAWSYSGGGYAVLEQVVHDLTGDDFDALARARVLARAGLHGSHFEQPFDGPPVGGAPVGSVLGQPVAPFTYPERPAAGLWTTALDLGRLIGAIQAALAGEPGALLGPGLARAMITPQSPGPSFFALGGPSADPRMGLGLFLAGGDDPGWFWHSGRNVGFESLIVGDTRGRGQGVAVMTNAWPNGLPLAWEIADGVAAIQGWPGWEE